uniref:Fatty acyl-CoA reductase n=1 Tax=Nilaparvata lugens TaxID=108931 RepID=A0A3S7L4F2_NILLU|nr:fatty acyl-CoA reductase [Nilaparvata lugens]
MAENAGSAIAEFYKGRSVLITGATGFMGKVLVEKLLFGCPDLSRIYVLIRNKRGLPPALRLEEMFKAPLFDRLRVGHPERFSKVTAVEGDVCLADLGLSASSRATLVTHVSVVFHCAASLRLEAGLKELVNANLEGTHRVLQLCSQLQHIKMMLHLSTAFCHVDVVEMEERVYSSDINPHDVINLTKWMDGQSMDQVTQRLISPHPNCYTYTKRLSETLVDQSRKQIPVAIARPSIVTPSIEEPMPGWVDNLNGPMGLLVGGGKGVIRTMHCRGELCAQVIPVDKAINAIIAFVPTAVAIYDKNRNAETPVLNITQEGFVDPVTWSEVLDKGKSLCWNHPFEMMLWYPNGSIHSSYALHYLCALLFHWLPAYFIDILMLVFQQKTFMVRIQTRIQEGLRVLQYFTTKEWKFHNRNLHKLDKSMSGVDKAVFPIGAPADFQLETYLKDCILGARLYLMKENPATLPRQRWVIRGLYVLDRLVTMLFYLFIMRIIYNNSHYVLRFFNSSTTGAVSLTPFNTRIK